jgi:Tol biopolymer transport system component
LPGWTAPDAPEGLFVYDWQHDKMSRLTFTGRNSYNPVWTPDEKHIAFDSPDGIW